MIDREPDIQGWLSIMAHLIRHSSQSDLDEFIKFQQSENECLKDIEEKLKYHNGRERILYTVQLILNECITNKDLAISLQSWFGQFDEAQICQNCGDIMWDGYSIHGDTYCNLDCCLSGADIELKDLAEELSHATEDNGDCYYTTWF